MSRSGAQALRTQNQPAPSTRSPWLAVAVFVGVALLLAVVAVLASWTLLDASASSAALSADLGGALALAFAGLAAATVGRGARALPAPVGSAQHRAHSVLGFAAGAFFFAMLWLTTQERPAGFAPVAGAPFVAWAALQLVVAVCAEYGWRGVLQPLLEAWIPRVGAALVVGVLWWLWQVPIAMGGAEAFVRLLASLVLSVLLGFLGNGSSWQRTLPAALARWWIILAGQQFLGDQVLGSAGWWGRYLVAAVVTTAVLMTMFVVATRRRRARAAGAAPKTPR